MLNEINRRRKKTYPQITQISLIQTGSVNVDN